MKESVPAKKAASTSELASLASTYQLLSRLWVREVDEPFLRYLCEPPLRDAFTAAGGVLPERVDPSTLKEWAGLDEWAVDYCQLFLGPKNHLPPYQSVWQRGQFQGEPAELMQKYVEASGCKTDGLMADHLGVQLDVMGRLLEFGANSAEHADEVRGLAENFFAEHLTWAAPLFELAANQARTDFYRSVIQMTQAFLDHRVSVPTR